ncbi:MAG TPA: pullulanase-type alpha-1,6-glucosidase [Patescibacteria group bacterium]|nr:pullulanase-type alpha-1,6-glucosidase [Patescibacteria group bacterium]
MKKKLLQTLLLLVSLGIFTAGIQAQEISTPTTVTIAGTIQSQLGCSDDWQPACESTFLNYDAENDIWTATWELTAGNYAYKAALNGTWDDNFGLLAQYDGPNIPLTVPENMAVTFTYDHNTSLVTDSLNNHVLGGASDGPVEVVNPDFVTIPGTIQEQLGCSGNWAPDCEATFLTLDEDDDIWQGTFELVGGDYEYKVAINQDWGENYGGRADPGGPNIPLTVPGDNMPVKFYYDHKSKWVADSVNSTIATVSGTFQDEAGCMADNDPACLRSWLQDPDGDGIYTTLVATEQGDYEAVVAINESLEESYGLDGVAGGDAYTFSVDGDVAAIFFSYNAEDHLLTIGTTGPPKGDISNRSAYWVSRETIAWDVDSYGATNFSLYYSISDPISLDNTGVTAENEIPLTLDPNGLDEAVTAKFPHLTGFAALKIGDENLNKVRIALKGQVAVGARDQDGSPVNAAGLQIPGVLDDVYPYDGPLGVTYDGEIPTLTVWAPTARSVILHLFDNPNQGQASTTLVLRPNPNTGIWSVTGDASWTGLYYLYEVEIFVPSEGKVVRNLVTDPYSVSLSMNSSHSQIIDLGDPALAPDGWENLNKPALEAPTDIVLYELHLRDFSARDQSVPAELRGTYRAFSETDSDGMAHLRGLAEAGLTHIHLLPTFDIATIEEDKSTWESVDFATLASFAPDSEEQQALLNPTRDSDGFNWGYDPFHYNVPEGSYSTDANGPIRILEFRQMVQSLNEAGLGVVLDVVYNHTNASGQAEKSVLDKVVPGYYHRLDAQGQVANSSCCANTATEHDMMRRLMVDSVVYWATQYKVDGFRFDLMGHHMVADMQAVRNALNALTLEEHGVDGSQIYIYGEGWDFGEVANGARGENASQLNIGGLGIGSFNDRVRDAIRGGNPFGGYQEQGFATGLFTDPNEVEDRNEEEQQSRLLHLTDQIRVALAGNLADYRFIGADGNEVAGRAVDYNGAPAGYTLSPQEHISYISAHDNETWFDAIQAKAPVNLTMSDRVRMQNLGLSVVMFGQGVPFFHAGSDILRSKSFDRDSYNSGDWFNALDWTYNNNNWGKGLPPADKNQDKWDIMQPLLADPTLASDQFAIIESNNAFQRLLRIRRSSPLFRLQTAEEIQARLAFLNTGPQQIPGLIVMSLSDVGQAENLDPQADMILVLFNATPKEQEFILPDDLAEIDFGLHPEQALLSDSTLRGEANGGVVHLPARSTTVLVALEGVFSQVQDTIETAREVEPQLNEEAAIEPEMTAAVAKHSGTSAVVDPEAEAESDGRFPVWLVALIPMALGIGGFIICRVRRTHN